MTLVPYRGYSSCMSSPATTAPTTHGAAQGETFRAAREGAGLSIRAIAKRAEVSHPTISLWERGLRQIGDPTYEHLVTTLADYMAGRWAA